ncbi:MAG TPA: hypothetical protein VFV10_01960 [Gammaproteobacteria bacterium]|nr:hypothetical protein [Gammaproteobacteria bacterium]
MPTLARAERAPLLIRAIDSVLTQRGVRAIPLVVINGPGADADLVSSVVARRDIRTIRLHEASLPAAIIAGRAAVDSPFFSELDDDDLLLPDAFRLRLVPFSADADLDGVISNGIDRGRGRDSPLFEDARALAADPLRALELRNWLCPGSMLLRSASVTAEIFGGMPAYLEWTYLAIRLAQHHRLAFIEQETFVHHTDTPQGTWTSEACKLGLPAAFDRTLELDLPRELRTRLEQKRTSAVNGAACADLRAGRVWRAWVWHLRCLLGNDGWRYLPFTRKLIQGLFKATPAGL